jgi:hypothetical protein
MEIRAELAKAERHPCELLLLFSFESPERLEGVLSRVDEAWKGTLSALVKQGDFKGEVMNAGFFIPRKPCPPEGSF